MDSELPDLPDINDRHNRSPVEETAVPVTLFSHVHTDLVGPLPPH